MPTTTAIPGARLLDAGEVAASNGWVAISGLNLPVTQGTYYWLAFDLQNANKVRYQTGLPATGVYYWARYSYGAFPAQYPSGGGTTNEQVVMRATVGLP